MVGFAIRVKMNVRVTFTVTFGLREGGLISTHTCMQGRVVRHAN